MSRVRTCKKWMSYKVIVPMILITYTTVMLTIQFGISGKHLLFSQTEIQSTSTLSDGGESDHDQANGGFQNEKSESEFSGPIHKHRNIFLSSRKLHRDRQLESLLLSENKTKVRKKGYKSLGDLTVFSVYIDNRTVLAAPVLRIMALKKFDSDDRIICQFNGGKNKWIKILSESYEMCENHGRYYGGWMFSCDVPREIYSNKVLARFTHITLSSELQPDKSVKLKITGATEYKSNHLDASEQLENVPENNSHQKTFGVCLPPIFGDVSLSLLIQFLELSKIMGASHFTFYEYSIPSTVQKLLNFYQDKGEVTLVNWKLPPEISDSEIWYHGQLIAIQDCLYRNMAKYDYLIFVDLDEFIVPVHNYTWPEMTEFLYRHHSIKSEKIAGFSFKSAFFDPKQVPDPSQQLTFLQLLQRNRVLSTKRTKLMVKSRKIFEMGIHHISRAMESNVSVFNVDPEMAKVHHYRPCIINYEPDMKCYSEVTDENILKYSEKLVERYQEIIRKTIELFLPSDH